MLSISMFCKRLDFDRLDTNAGLGLILMSCWAQVMDYGYPQFTEAKILSEFIKTDAYKMEVSIATLGKHQSSYRV